MFDKELAAAIDDEDYQQGRVKQSEGAVAAIDFPFARGRLDQGIVAAPEEDHLGAWSTYRRKLFGAS